MGIFGGIFGVTGDVTTEVTGGEAGPPYVKRFGAWDVGTAPANAACSASPVMPTHEAGDILLLQAEANFGSTSPQNTALTLATANGFVAVTGAPVTFTTAGANAGTQLGLWWKRAASSSELAPVAVDGHDHVSARIIVIGGAKSSGDPINVIATDTNATATTQTLPGVTTTVDRCLVIAMLSTASDKATNIAISSWSNADIELAVRTDYSTTTGNGGGFGMLDGVKLVAGAVGTTALGLSFTQAVAMLTLAIEPGEAGTADGTPPVIDNFDPPAGDDVRKDTVISFDVTDETGLTLTAIIASFPDGTCEVVHDGDEFRGNYLNTDNTRSVITGGYHFTVRRDNGWHQSPTFEYLVLDGGNMGEVA